MVKWRGKSQRKLRGQFCWNRPNKAFLGKKHSRHLCHACVNLGMAELAHPSDDFGVHTLFGDNHNQ